VPLPWEADAPSYGFGPSDASWLPQPATWAEYALDRQQGVPGSTWELYRAALALRREHGLGAGILAWQDAEGDTLAFRNGDLLVLTSFGAGPVALPVGARVLLSSEPLDDDGRVPGDVTVWAQL
jgi:alpha-glucosidase